MKPISEMTLAECVERLKTANVWGDLVHISNRIHELTRWIPVSERMPTEEDLNELGFVAIYDGGFIDRAIIKKGVVKVWDYEDKSWADFDASNWELSFTHWQRITPPTKEGK